MKISVIIPTLNEAKNVSKTLETVISQSEVEVIVVDGGSVDNTLEKVQQLGVKVLQSSQANKAIQMNLGASLSTGEILLFLHGDTQLPQNYARIIIEILVNPVYVAGAFRLKIDQASNGLKMIETLVNWRSQWLSLPYGDQGLFLKKSTFQQLGGFKPLPIMEDFDLVRRLNQRGKIAIAPQTVITSNRRWRKLGVIRTTLLNQLILLSYYAGISPHILAKWYGR